MPTTDTAGRAGTEARTEAPGWRFFDTTVARTRRLGPSLVRLTLAGPDLAGFGTAGNDQRIKLVIPRAGRDPQPLLVDGPEWYASYLSLADDVRPYLRTYTVRAARPDRAELDVDVVLHGVTEGHAGPAATWAASAGPGDRLMILGPDRPGRGRMWGVEWAPPASASSLLLAGDETAVPAVGAILESLPPGRRALVVLEVPEAGDEQSLDVPAGTTVRWLARGRRPRGDLLVPQVHAALAELGLVPAGRDVAATAVDVDPTGADELLWEVPDPEASAGFYAWLAGESGVVKRLRRHLVSDLGVPRTSVAFMGYWKVGVTG